MNIRKTKQSETEINGKSYTITQFQATTGVKYLKKIQKLFVPVWAELVGTQGAVTPEVITLASEKFYDLDEKDLQSMICDSLSITPSNYESEFSGHYIGLFNLVKEIIVFNYEDVFTQLGLEGI